jgi:hypothetical protein
VKVFISWSGRRSHETAEALAGRIKKVIQNADPWISSDMERGVKWLAEIGKSLDTHSIGILCVTPGNVKAPWLNFEAGALSKQIGDEVRVIPYLLDFQRAGDLQPPLGQFNASVANEQGTWDLVKTLNAHSQKVLSDEDLRETFEMWWPRLRDKLRTIIDSSDGQPPERRSNEDKIDEILTGIRDLIRRSQDGTSEIADLVAKYGGWPEGTPLSDMFVPANLSRVVSQDPAGVRLRRAQRALEMTLQSMDLSSLRGDFHLSWVEPDEIYVVVPDELFLDGVLFNRFRAMFGELVGSGSITFRGDGNSLGNMMADLNTASETIQKTLAIFGLPDSAMRASHPNREEIEIIEPHSLASDVGKKVAQNLLAVFPTVNLIKFVRSNGEPVDQIARPAVRSD